MTCRPQEPKPPFPYLAEEVQLTNKLAGVTLAGTLTRPNLAGPAAAVLLVPGSGTQDRDESLCGHRPFLVLADHLTRSGLVVLRLDDRGVGGSTGDKDECGHEELLSDVRIALDFLTLHEAVDPNRLGLVGHSEGACLAAAAAGQFPDLAFVVLLACAAGRGEDGIHEQSVLMARAAGATEEQIEHERRMNDRVFEILKGRSTPKQPVRPFGPFLRSSCEPGRVRRLCRLPRSGNT
jgi:pimeloyl-ACP methyl ester carboxylesterase